MDEFRRQAGILGESVRNPSKAAGSIVGASFHHATFSERIWANQAALKSELDKLLQTGMIQGRHPRELARKLQKSFGVSRAQAERLMRTELARVQTEAQRKSLEANGFEEFVFIALESGCEICRDMDGKHFPVAKMAISENAPPMHPHCRCSIAPYDDDDEYEKWMNELLGGDDSAEKDLSVDHSIKPKYAGAESVVPRDIFHPVNAEVNAPRIYYRKIVNGMNGNKEIDAQEVTARRRKTGEGKRASKREEKLILPPAKHQKISRREKTNRSHRNTNRSFVMPLLAMAGSGKRTNSATAFAGASSGGSTGFGKSDERAVSKLPHGVRSDILDISPSGVKLPKGTIFSKHEYNMAIGEMGKF